MRDVEIVRNSAILYAIISFINHRIVYSIFPILTVSQGYFTLSPISVAFGRIASFFEIYVNNIILNFF